MNRYINKHTNERKETMQAIANLTEAQQQILNDESGLVYAVFVDQLHAVAKTLESSEEIVRMAKVIENIVIDELSTALSDKSGCEISGAIKNIEKAVEAL